MKDNSKTIITGIIVLILGVLFLIIKQYEIIESINIIGVMKTIFIITIFAFAILIYSIYYYWGIQEDGKYSKKKRAYFLYIYIIIYAIVIVMYYFLRDNILINKAMYIISQLFAFGGIILIALSQFIEVHLNIKYRNREK